MKKKKIIDHQYITGMPQLTIILPKNSESSCPDETFTTVRLSWAVQRLKPLVTGLSPRRPGFAPGSVHMGFVVVRVAMGQDLLRVTLFSPVNIIPLWFSIFMYHLGDEQQANRWLQFRDILSPHRHEQQEDFRYMSQYVKLCHILTLLLIDYP
jgi:hypothetical protein